MNKLALLLAVPLIAYGQNANTTLDSRERPITEIFRDHSTRQVLELEEIARKVGGWVDTAGEWLNDTYRSAELGFKLKGMLEIDINDDVVKQYLIDNYPKITINPDVIRFSGDSAYVQAEYNVHFDDAVIVKQYLLKLEGNTPLKIIGHGSEWAERYGNKIEIDELFDIIKLDKTYNERWNERKSSEGLDWERSAEAFEILSKSIKDYNPSDDPVVISQDMTRAQVGTKYVIRDEYENVVDDITSYEIEQYVNTQNGWKFDEVLYSSKWKEGILIGTGKNRFQNDSWMERKRNDIKEWFKGLYEGL